MMGEGRWLVSTAVLGGALLASGCVVHATTYEDPTPHPRQHVRRHHPQSQPRPPAPKPAPDQAAATPSAPAHQPATDVTAQPVRQEPPRSSSRPEVLPPGSGDGRPPGFKPGAPAAYWIWQGPRGRWRIRTTTKSQPHVFRGHAQGTDGVIVDVRPTSNELQDRMWQVDSGWAFSFKTAGHADGFTFATRGGGCVRFDLLLDGGPQPKRIFIGKGGISPRTSHFILCPKGTDTPR